MENKLSDKQIEKALEVVVAMSRWPMDTAQPKDQLRAAAPYLQFPLEEPSEEEVRSFAYDLRTSGNNTWEGCCRDALSKMLAARRNAALLPKPDPRREAIEAVLDKRLGVCQVHQSLNMKALANEVLAALKQVEEVGK